MVLIQEGRIFRDIANMDALCLVVRAFEDDSVYHVNCSVDPVRDINEMTGELVLHDLVFIQPVDLLHPSSGSCFRFPLFSLSS